MKDFLLGLCCMAGILITARNTPFDRAHGGEKPTIVILLGPPGAGKGTLAPDLSNYLKTPHISTGDLFREHIRNLTPTGKRAKEFIDRGNLVPDEIVLEMLFARLQNKDCQKGAILDGVPRTLDQAKSLDREIVSTHRLVVLQLDIASDLLIERISGRITCKSCGRSFHKTNNPPREKDICDSCGGALIQRADDTEEILRKRLEVYREQTEPLIEYYKQKPDVVHEINANQSKMQMIEDAQKIFSPALRD